MKLASKHNTLQAALAFLSLPILPAAADYCTFNNASCIDGLAQVSVSFVFDAISPAPILFYYGFDAGLGSPGNETLSAVKVGYWLQYDRKLLTDFNSDLRGVNWTTEVALRIGKLDGYVGGTNNGCDGVWGDSCSENLKRFLRSSIFNLSISGVPYDLPLNTVLQPLTTGSQGPSIDGCPSTLFQLDHIPTYAAINATTVGSKNASESVSVAAPGNPASPWRTWYIPGAEPLGHAKEVAVGIIARGPTRGSNPLNNPDDIQVELICAKAPRQHRHHPFDISNHNGDNKLNQGYARGIIKTYAFNENDFEYEVKDDGEELENEEGEEEDDLVTGANVDCPEGSAIAL